MSFKRLKKRVFTLFTAICIVSSSSFVYAAPISMNLFYDGVSHSYKAEEVKIRVNGDYINNFVVPPVILNDRTLVPARAVFESLGAEVTWNEGTKEVYVMQNGNLVVLTINSPQAIKNGVAFKMDIAPKIINDSTMIPVRAVSEALDCNVGWDEKTRIVDVYEDGKYVPETPTPKPETPKPETPPSVSPPVETPSEGEVNVTGVIIPVSPNDRQAFTINASGVIGKYQVLNISNQKIAIDIYNSNMAISNTNMVLNNNTYVSSIRSAQNQVKPEKITRVVFDLKGLSKYSVDLSSDKKSIVVSFQENTIKDLIFKSEADGDYIILTGETAPNASITTLTNPNRIVVDMGNSTSTLKESYNATGGKYVTGIRASQYDEKTSRVVIDVNANVEYNISQSGNTCTIQIFKSTLTNVSYDSSGKTIVLKKISGMDINNIIHNDQYLNKKYMLTLPGNYLNDYGFGKYKVGDSYLTSFSVENNGDNRTVITIDEAQILAYTITEDSNNIYIKAQLPKEKHQKIVVLDAGHGNGDPGTSGNGLVEKTVNLDILLRVHKKLEANPDIKVYATRTTDSYPENSDRAKMANDIGDLFVSIHQNSASPNTVPNGTEVLYTPHSNEVAGKLTSKIAAQFMQDYIIRTLGSNNRGIKDRPDLLILNQTKVPAILIECSFLSNPADAANMASESYKESLADTIYSAIVDMTNQYKLR